MNPDPSPTLAPARSPTTPTLTLTLTINLLDRSVDEPLLVRRTARQQEPAVRARVPGYGQGQGQSWGQS